MQIQVAFGKTGLQLTLPEGPEYQVLETKPGVAVEDVGREIAYALDNPLGRPPLAELAKSKKTAAIAVCDITRPAPNAITLPPLLAQLHAGGIEKQDVMILIATGLHRPARGDEIRAIVGEEISGNYRVENHFAKDLTSHAKLGVTRSRTPVYVDRRFVEADLHITLGFIEQHLMAGFSGGRKLITPGLAAQETIKILHSPKFMRDLRAVEGSLEENPLHNELLEIAAMVRHDFMLDVTLTRSRQIAGVFAGDGVQAHEAGVRFLRQTLLERLAEPFDAVITTGAGYPLDLTFYQTIKGVTAAQHIVKPGGTILLIGECREGVGAPEFASKLAGLSTYEDYLSELDSAPVEVDQWQLEKLAMVGRRYNLLFYTPGIPRERTGGLAHRMFPSVDSAVSELIRSLPRNARVGVIPDGLYVFARVDEPAMVL